jgi:4-amino-4-deoxy-L-arabinose transferase-like glycosyltransferase
MRGWVPHDEGAFAQSADRVLHGELPHRDYTEIYTGGLAYLNALAFRYFGENLATLRIVLFAFFFFWVPVFYWIASRLVSDWLAGGITLLAVAWSLPNYSAAVPSWYSLFFATFGLAAVLLYLEKRSSQWLFLAGLFGGLSFLAKSVAIFYVAAVLLFFLFCEQDLSSSESAPEKRRSLVYTSLLVLAMVMLPLALVILTRPISRVEHSLDFVVPSAMLAAVVVVRESRSAGRPSRERFVTLLKMCIPFVFGFLLPVLLFIFRYVHEGAQSAFLRGVFVLPSKRLFSAFMDPPDIMTTVPSLCLVGMLAMSGWLRGAAKWILVLLAAILGAYYLVSSGHNVVNYGTAWHAAYWLTPFLAASGAFVLWPRARGTALFPGSIIQQRLFLILSVSSLCALIQFPFSAPIYFCYVAPLVILAGVAVLASFPSIPRPLLAVVFTFFLLFAMIRVTPPFIYATGFYYQADPETHVLNLPRAGKLKVDAESVKIYERLISLIRQHAEAGGIYAAPDCPQIYFLSGHANPTRAQFDFFEDDYGDIQRVLRLVDEQSIRVVVLNTRPSFSAMLPLEVHEALAKRFPKRERIANFEVLWRD